VSRPLRRKIRCVATPIPALIYYPSLTFCQLLGIRVNGVAPGLIRTPLWTEHPEKLTLVDNSKDEWATAEEVAEGMLRCLEDPDLGGGTILEIGKGQTRLVEAVNDPGPSGRGHTVSNQTGGYEEVYGWLETKGWGKAKL
jgi:hypothetical protein